MSLQRLRGMWPVARLCLLHWTVAHTTHFVRRLAQQVAAPQQLLGPRLQADHMLLYTPGAAHNH